MFSVFESLQLSSYTRGYDVGVGSGGGGEGMEYGDFGVSNQLCIGHEMEEGLEHFDLGVSEQ